ncbi:glucokinase [Pendulispora brunnea]|uniref:Glucokinase n=1 Tax=Pendulispora brunnea TaxID=2905690 RepID=A0ABZ2KRA0_9BACT
MILAADVGGTNARLAIYTADGEQLVRRERFASTEYKSFEDVARAFLKPDEKPLAACIGVAGPVVDGRVVATNLPWVLDERIIAQSLGIPRVALINDLVALSMGALHARAEDLVLLHGGALPRTKGANLAVLAAGTGLGEAVLVWDGEKHAVCATEGGHVDYAPRNEIEIELLRYLISRVKGRVSYERILSGPGIGNLYDFFREAKNIPEDDAIAQAIASAEDRNSAITKFGTTGESTAAARAMKLFISLYGAEAGNLVLKSLALGGIFVMGKIAVTLTPQLVSKGFVESFLDKGRMRSLLEKVPIALVTDSTIGLSGSARYAALLYGKPPTL